MIKDLIKKTVLFLFVANFVLAMKPVSSDFRPSQKSELNISQLMILNYLVKDEGSSVNPFVKEKVELHNKNNNLLEIEVGSLDNNPDYLNLKKIYRKLNWNNLLKNESFKNLEEIVKKALEEYERKKELIRQEEMRMQEQLRIQELRRDSLSKEETDEVYKIIGGQKTLADILLNDKQIEYLYKVMGGSTTQGAFNTK